MGKTTAIENFLRRKSVRVFDGQDGYFKDMDPLDMLSEEILYFKDISQIADVESQEYLTEAVRLDDKMVILEGRGALPPYLMEDALSRNFIMTGNADLALDDDSIDKLFEEVGVPLTNDERMQLVSDTSRNTLMISLIAQRIKKDEGYIESVFLDASHLFYRYLEEAFFNRLDQTIQEELMMLARCDSFTVGLGEMLTGNNNFRHEIEQMSFVGDFIVAKSKYSWSIRNVYRNYLIWRQDLFMTERQRNEFYDRAAIYYELHDDYVKALEAYRNSQNYEKLENLLCKVVDANPGMENYQEIETFMNALPIDRINAHPILMSGMSIMNSIELNPEGSERWYDRLKYFADHAKKGSLAARESASRLLFLDLALPHRGTDHLLETLNKVVTTTKTWIGSYKLISIIDSTPSIINGGLDFCTFIKDNLDNFSETGEYLQRSIEIVLGDNAIGFVQLLEIEHHFEQAKIDLQEMNSSLNEIFIWSDSNGTLETSTVAIALMAKAFICQGAYEAAASILDSFRKKLVRKKAKNLLKTMDTINMWMGLLKGEVSKANEWLADAPNSTEQFSFLDRYYYIHKLRVLITLGRLEEAASLSSRLRPVFEHYRRDYFLIQTLVFQAIIYHRKNNSAWMRLFEEALQRAQEFGYVRIISFEGSAVLKLLNDPDFKPEKVDPAYLKSVTDHAKVMSKYYPDYLREIANLKEPLTEREHEVLQLMCSGKRTEDICDVLHITYNSLKFHKRNIYRKLGVNNQHEAEHRARSLGLNLK